VRLLQWWRGQRVPATSRCEVVAVVVVVAVGGNGGGGSGNRDRRRGVW
jgi:hypothetical protein